VDAFVHRFVAEALMRRSIVIAGVFGAVLLASSTGFALRNRPGPVGAEHRIVWPSADVAQGDDRPLVAEAAPPKRAARPQMVTPEEPAAPVARDIAEMICRPVQLSAGPAGARVLVCE